MISKQKIEFIRSLSGKKEREKAGLFVAEGGKLVFDLLQTSLVPAEFYCTAEALANPGKDRIPDNAFTIREKDMERISAFKNPPSVLALFEIPERAPLTDASFQHLCLVLDRIQDPGNFGTIVRTADWFGIREIFCSTDCADIFSPKCVQASMGAIARVRALYLELPELLQRAADLNIPVYGAYMNGENIFSADLSANALVVMGSEGKGISPELERCLTKRISIPPYPSGENSLESLNVAVSASIICAEFRRRLTLPELQ